MHVFICTCVTGELPQNGYFWITLMASFLTSGRLAQYRRDRDEPSLPPRLGSPRETSRRGHSQTRLPPPGAWSCGIQDGANLEEAFVAVVVIVVGTTTRACRGTTTRVCRGTTLVTTAGQRSSSTPHPTDGGSESRSPLTTPSRQSCSLIEC